MFSPIRIAANLIVGKETKKMCLREKFNETPMFIEFSVSVIKKRFHKTVQFCEGAYIKLERRSYSMPCDSTAIARVRNGCWI